MVGEEMRKIKLTQNKYTLVDDKDFEWLKKIDWRYSINGYAFKSYYIGGGRKNTKVKTIYMHRLINDTPKGIGTDHINRNKLDNRRSNLRTATQAQNLRNLSIRRDNTSGFSGVCWHKDSKKWWSRIQNKGKTISLGLFFSIYEAISARKQAEIKYYEF